MTQRLALSLLLVLAAAPLQAADPVALSRMPVREVTVFKDGHAFVLHEGSVPVDPSGDVVLDELPAPVLGTFWPFSSEKGAPLRSVVAGKKRVSIQKTPLGLLEFVEANPGAEVAVTEKAVSSGKEGASYDATLVGIPVRSGAEVEASLPPGSGPRLPEWGSVVLLKTGTGTKVLPLDRIQDITLKGSPKKAFSSEEIRNSLTLDLDWGGRSHPAEARVGLAYLQKGLRWIPSYRVELDGKGAATVRLQATLVNDLTDMENVAVNLVIGVPTFAFGDDVDPIALPKDPATLQREMGQIAYLAPSSQLASGFSNAMMTQTASNVGGLGGDEERSPRGPSVSGGERTEDLFVFALHGVTLRKGERMVLPVGEASFHYKDVYTLEIPALPPPEVAGQRTLSGREAEVARQLASPKVMHKIRWTNTGKEPLTTAPALVFSGGRPLAQGLMTYAAPGAEEELEITAAVDISSKLSESETRRTPDAVRWNNDLYARVDLKGVVSLTNRRAEAVTLEVTRRVLGEADTATAEGAIKKLNPLTEGETATPGWWSWYSWPYWWNHFNGLGKITWKVTLDPAKSAELEYSWHYYWR
jgi:hypothetical protein